MVSIRAIIFLGQIEDDCYVDNSHFHTAVILIIVCSARRNFNIMQAVLSLNLHPSGHRELLPQVMTNLSLYFSRLFKGSKNDRLKVYALCFTGLLPVNFNKIPKHPKSNLIPVRPSKTTNLFAARFWPEDSCTTTPLWSTMTTHSALKY